ncbi:hypothetical protein [Pseudomonas monsensis]|uniref:hypothetical protein n=1 Tax=Pseudomonas monsensis TaxID=2745509 RepID=UPI003D2479D7
MVFAIEVWRQKASIRQGGIQRWMSRWSSQPYLKAGRKAGVPEDTPQNAVKTAKQTKHGCPLILTLNHLAHLAGAPYPFLHRTISRTYGFSIEPGWAREYGSRLKEICANNEVDHVTFP